MHDRLYPRGWDTGPTFDGPLPQAQLDRLIPWAIPQKATSIQTYKGNDGDPRDSVNGVHFFRCIRANAFVASPYPLILSLEDHCSVAQQDIMAGMFKEVFGSTLLVEPVHTKDEKYLPSPEQLMYKVLLKHKVPKETKAPSEEVSPEVEVDEGKVKLYIQELLVAILPVFAPFV